MERDGEGLLRAYTHPQLREARACPFCGGKNLGIFPGGNDTRFQGATMRVTCATGLSQGPTGLSEEQAVARWNGESDRSRHPIRRR
jgi:hypothetical protein